MRCIGSTGAFDVGAPTTGHESCDAVLQFILIVAWRFAVVARLAQNADSVAAPELKRRVPMPGSKDTQASTRRVPKKTPAADLGKPSAELIDARIADLNDWRGALLARLRAVIRSADPEIVEEWKWNVPVWSCAGILCTGETYKKAVKLTFAKGAALADPARLFNASLEGNVRRAIDFAEGADVDEPSLAALVRAAVSLNRSCR